MIQGRKKLGLPLPVVPFKTTVRRLLRLFQQLPQPTDVVLLPGLLGKVHVGRIEMALGSDFLRVRPQALLFLCFLGASGFPMLFDAARLL